MITHNIAEKFVALSKKFVIIRKRTRYHSKENKKAICRFMLDGEQYTKQQVSAGTGLSVATCNTLLNDKRTSPRSICQSFGSLKALNNIITKECTRRRWTERRYNENDRKREMCGRYAV